MSARAAQTLAGLAARLLGARAAYALRALPALRMVMPARPAPLVARCHRAPGIESVASGDRRRADNTATGFSTGDRKYGGKPRLRQVKCLPAPVRNRPFYDI